MAVVGDVPVMQFSRRTDPDLYGPLVASELSDSNPQCRLISNVRREELNVNSGSAGVQLG